MSLSQPTKELQQRSEKNEYRTYPTCSLEVGPTRRKPIKKKKKVAWEKVPSKARAQRGADPSQQQSDLDIPSGPSKLETSKIRVPVRPLMTSSRAPVVNPAERIRKARPLGETHRSPSALTSIPSLGVPFPHTELAQIQHGTTSTRCFNQ